MMLRRRFTIIIIILRVCGPTLSGSGTNEKNCLLIIICDCESCTLGGRLPSKRSRAVLSFSGIDRVSFIVIL